MDGFQGLLKGLIYLIIFVPVDNDILSRIENPIKFTQKGGRDNVLDAYGYEVTILIDICSAVIDANRAGDFNDTTIVRNADIIIRSVAKVGIIALVDEVTGYNKDKSRAKDELQQFLNKFINREMSKWIRTFDDDFLRCFTSCIIGIGVKQISIPVSLVIG